MTIVCTCMHVVFMNPITLSNPHNFTIATPQSFLLSFDLMAPWWQHLLMIMIVMSFNIALQIVVQKPIHSHVHCNNFLFWCVQVKHFGSSFKSLMLNLMS